MHERKTREILLYAQSGKAPVLTPIEKAVYNSFRQDVLNNVNMEWYIPTDLPDSGIEMRYAGVRGDVLTID